MDFINSEFEIKNLEDYCLVTYKMPHNNEEVSLSTAEEAVKQRKYTTKQRKFICAIEPSVTFSKEAIRYFSQDVSIKGIDSSAIYRQSDNAFDTLLIKVSNLFFNMFLLFKYNPKMRFFSNELSAIKWIKKQ